MTVEQKAPEDSLPCFAIQQPAMTPTPPSRRCEPTPKAASALYREIDGGGRSAPLTSWPRVYPGL